MAAKSFTTNNAKTNNKNEYRARSITLNLLPNEVILKRLQRSKLMLINKLSVLVLLLLIFFSTATLVLRVSQNQIIAKSQENLTFAQNKITNLQKKELEVLLLKQRLNNIQSLTGNDQKRKAIFNLIASLIPADIKISEMIVDKNGQAMITLQTSSLSSFDNFLSQLSSKEKNSDIIDKVDLDGLSFGRDLAYRFVLKISQK